MHSENTPPRHVTVTPAPCRAVGDPHDELARDLGIRAPGFTTRGLGPDPESLRQAREFVRDSLERWGLRSCADEVALVAGELMSNAVCHGLPPAAASTARLGLARQDSTLVCAVNDPSPELPVLRAEDEFLERGRGMRIVDALSSSWGWSRPTRAGKTVWARIAVPGIPGITARRAPPRRRRAACARAASGAPRPPRCAPARPPCARPG